MNYSVFKLQNQGGKPSIFWEKDPSGFPTVPQPNLESIAKKDKKFGYKNRVQRFPVRRYPEDTHHVDTGLVALTPDEPLPPPKPAKNFIRRNREKLVTKKKDPNSTVTLTQEQLNAILKSVGKVAGGSENAVKISIGGDSSKEITIESPRRRDNYDDDDDYVEDEREKRRSKKRAEPKEEQASIYSLLNGSSKPKNTSDSDGNLSEESLELVKTSRRVRRRQERKPRRNYDDEEEDENRNNKYRRSKSKKKYEDDDDDELKIRRDYSKPRKYDNDDEDYYERIKREAKTRKNRSKNRDDDDDDDYDNARENRRRKNRSKPRDDSYDDIDDNRDNDTRERVRKSNKDRTRVSRRDDHSKERKDRSHERDTLNESETKDPEEVPSPRDKIGLPNDLSWRHMTKAERRRLEMARQKFLDDEERQEQERKQQINMQLGLAERRAPVRSDPNTRVERRHHGRDTESSSHTDGFRRDRRSRSPEDNRSRTPDRTSEVSLLHQSPDTSPKAPLGIPRRHMTLAEKKRVEWERDRVESVQLQKANEPWGRPGAGAPLRSRSGNVVADYKGRQENLRNVQAIQEEGGFEDHTSTVNLDDHVLHGEPRHRADPRPDPQSTSLSIDTGIPHAMRSSFVIGQAAPDMDMNANKKEMERKQWLADLEKQIEEKRLKEMKNVEVQREEDTWASKLGTSHRALPFPDQPKDTVSATGDFGSTLNASTGGLESQRVSSAPNAIDSSDGTSYIRGQNVPIDPLTKKELEDKRQKYLDHQNAIKAQVEEKERLKRMERDRKMKEDMEEERKLQDERDLLKKQFESEQQKQRQKEAQRQAQVNQLKAAMDEAQARALQEKYQRKMERLEAGGHDTSKLREHLEGEITSRIEQLHTRRERDIQRAQKQFELQHWGLKPLEESPSVEPKKERVEPSKTETPAKITPRSEEKSYNMMIEPTHVPGLDLSTARTAAPQAHAVADITTRSKHEPYTSDRVLTPSRFRHPSKPWSDPASPRREFATQTGNQSDTATELDGDDVNQILNQSISRDDTDANIEYRMERERRVRVISAPKEELERRKRPPQPKPPRQSSRSKSPYEPPSQTYREQMSPHQHHHEVAQQKEQEEERKKQRLAQRRKGPVKPGSRPNWGYKNPDNRMPKKQSERDPFFEQKKRESERRRLRREQQLLAMVEKNKEIIPEYHVPAERAARSRDPSPFSDFGGETPREVRLARRSKSHSPNRLNSTAYSDFLAVHSDNRQHNQGRSPKRERSPSPTRSRSPGPQQGDGQRPRGRSPPIPALKHRNEAYAESHASNRKGGKYKDVNPLDIPLRDGEFVPFTRTIDVLDPAKAEEPMPLSREATRVANARKTYYEGLNPDKFGERQSVYQDKDRMPRGPEDLKNPLFNPALVTDYPTTRQDQILMQLSTLKQSLMQRQRELETFSPSDLEKQATNL